MGFQQIMWAYGGSWGDPVTYKVRGHADSEQAVAALQFMKDLLKCAPPGAANFDYANSVETFVNGSTAMSMNYFAFYPDLAQKMGAKAGFFVMPSKNEKRVVSLGGQGFSISTKVSPAQQEMAKKFIAWFLTTEVQKKWITKPAGFTANTAVLKSDEFRNATAYNQPFAESLDYLRDFWNVPQYNELLAAAQRYLGEALDGVKSPVEALAKIAEEHEAIFKEAGFLK
jgi:multiple sugar transport system substrate-binding protein